MTKPEKRNLFDIHDYKYHSLFYQVTTFLQ